MKVGVILDVEHKSPWVGVMAELIPTGSLVLVLDEPDASGDIQFITDERVGAYWWAHSSSVEILSDL